MLDSLPGSFASIPKNQHNSRVSGFPNKKPVYSITAKGFILYEISD
jgi:hypothetical protein